MNRRWWIGMGALWVLAGTSLASPRYNRTFNGVLEDPLGNLPLVLDALPGQVSSHDRSGGNDDGFSGAYSFLRTTAEGEYVIFEREGPGLVSHLWFTDPEPAERIRLYFDAEPTPRLDLPIFELFRGSHSPFLVPLVGDDSRSSGGFYVYLPMPFREGLRITTTGIPRFFHIGYLEFEDARGVESFDPELDAAGRQLLHATLRRWEQRGDPALEFAPQSRLEESGLALAPGTRSLVFEAQGSGVIDGLIVESPPDLDWQALGELRLLAYWDGAQEASVDAPLRDFFGTSYQPVDYASVPLGMSQERFYSYFRMPFARGARIVIENASGRAVPELRVRVFYRRLATLPAGMGRFHARFSEEVAAQGRPIEILRRSGRGHYVGVSMSIRRAEQVPAGLLLFLEGDEQIYLDGARQPQLHGTGTEDYFNGGWYFKHGTFSLPFHGHPFRDVESGRIAVYRFHVLDPIPFQREIQAFIEHGMGNDRVGTRYRLVAYWYEDPAASPAPLSEPPGGPLEGLRVVPAPPGAPALREAAPRLRASAPFQYGLFELMAPGSSGGHLLRLLAEQPGDFLELPLLAAVPDRYALSTFYCAGPEQGIFRMELDGAAVGSEVDAYAPSFEANREARSGSLRLRGEAMLRLVVAGRNPASRGQQLSVTGVALESLAPLAERWWVLGPLKRSSFAPVSEIERGQIDLRATHVGKGGRSVRWQQARAHEGVLDLDAIFGGIDGAVAYALTYLHAERASEPGSTLLLGSDDGVRVYLGGQKVHENRVARGLVRDQDRVPVSYREGVTPILVKIFENVGGWQLSLRISDPHAALRYEYQ